MRHLCTWLAVLVGFGVAVGVPTRAAEKADPERIAKLIDKLSSGRFAEREKAHKALDEIGLPALAALRKAAAESKDPEAKRRAGELAAKLEKQALAAKVLAPSRLRLVYKDTPLKEAVEDFKKKSGYDLALHDPDKKLQDRKVTLDTGETTFWQAFDQFCARAGLVEAGAEDLLQQPLVPPGAVPGALPGVRPLPAIRLQPARQLRLRPAPPAAKPAPPADKEVRLEKGAARLAGTAEEKPADKPAKGQGAPAAPAVAPPPPLPPAPPAVQPAPVRGRVLRLRPARQGGLVPAMPSGQIVLKDGKAKELPTDYSGAVRFQAMDDVRMLGGSLPGEVLVGLRVSPEPKLRWQRLAAVRVDKAVDDQGQSLTPVMGDTAPPAAAVPFAVVGGGFGGRAVFPGYAGPHQLVPVRLKKGDKVAKTIEELKGSLSAEVLTEPEVVLSADNILKAAGKTFKGTGSGSIKVNGVEENGQQLTLKVEVEQPADVVPAGQNNVGGWGGGFPGGGIQVLPAVPPQALPVLPPGAFQVQVQQVQVAPVQVQIVGGPGFVVGSGGGLELHDDKGNVIPYGITNMVMRAAPGGAFTVEQHLTFQLPKGQKPARLVFKGSKRVTVDIPFALKNVPIS